MLFKVDFQNDNLIWVQNTTEKACYFSIEHYFSISYITRLEAPYRVLLPSLC